MLKAEELTYKIRGAIFEVSRQLGAGFLEKVYEILATEKHGKHGIFQCLPCLSVAKNFSLSVNA